MNNFSADESGVREMLESLSTKKIMGIEKKVLRKAANELRKKARSNLRRDLPMASKKGKYPDTLVEGIMTSTQLVDDGIQAKVHIMGKRSKSSGTFRTRFFEGVRDTIRKTKKGYNRGKLKHLNFFGNAIDTTKSKVQDTIDTELSKSIQAIADRKYG